MKERLTEAALDLIWHNSCGTTSVDAICERAGAAKGSFYYFFKSKSELAPAAYAAAFRSADVALTMRFHALVFALGLKVPAVAIDYSFAGGKVASLARLHGVDAFPVDALESASLCRAVTAQLNSPFCPEVPLSLIASLGHALGELGLPLRATDPGKGGG